LLPYQVKVILEYETSDDIDLGPINTIHFH
jgi:hypothetical protein